MVDLVRKAISNRCNVHLMLAKYNHGTNLQRQSVSPPPRRLVFPLICVAALGAGVITNNQSTPCTECCFVRGPLYTSKDVLTCFHRGTG
jgi:hypothetical protein